MGGAFYLQVPLPPDLSMQELATCFKVLVPLSLGWSHPVNDRHELPAVKLQATTKKSAHIRCSCCILYHSKKGSQHGLCINLLSSTLAVVAVGA